ncbi:MAG: DDE-type integrase/transposase/recombinase [Gammaproteobacteria bacterium]
MPEDLAAEVEIRIARLMPAHDGLGWPHKRNKRRGRPSIRPEGVVNHLERDFTAQEPEPSSREFRTLEGKLYLRVVLDLYCKPLIGQAMHQRQDRHRAIRPVEMAIWQRQEASRVVLHSDRGCQFTRGEYQRFLHRNALNSSMRAVGH